MAISLDIMKHEDGSRLTGESLNGRFEIKGFTRAGEGTFAVELFEIIDRFHPLLVAPFRTETH
jgi:hypothetical protein